MKEPKYVNLFKILSSSVVALSLITGCSGNELGSGETIKMSIPLAVSPEKYEMRTVEVPRPKNLSTLESDFIIFSQDKPASYRNDETRTVYQETSKPYFDFVLKGDVYIPSTRMQSLEAATVYYHMSRFKALADEMDLVTDDFWPQSASVTAKLGRIENNVGYLPLSRSVVFFPYTLDGVSGPFNANVFYHEMFHGILFNRVVTKLYPGISYDEAMYRLIESDSNRFEDVYSQLASLDEGFADLFSFLANGDESIVDDFFGRDHDRIFGKLEADALPYSNDKINSARRKQNQRNGSIGSPKESYKNGFFLANQFLTEAMGTYKTSLNSITQKDRKSILVEMMSFVDSVLSKVISDGEQINDEKINSNIDSFWDTKKKQLLLVDQKNNQELNSTVEGAK